MNEVLYDTSISLDMAFVFEFVKCLCIGAPSKDPERGLSNFEIFEKQEKQESSQVENQNKVGAHKWLRSVNSNWVC